jgi:hypothetical protein
MNSSIPCCLKSVFAISFCLGLQSDRFWRKLASLARGKVGCWTLWRVMTKVGARRQTGEEGVEAEAHVVQAVGHEVRVEVELLKLGQAMFPEVHPGLDLAPALVQHLAIGHAVAVSHQTGQKRGWN